MGLGRLFSVREQLDRFSGSGVLSY